MCKDCDCPEGVNLFATNVLYQTELPNWSILLDKKCVTIEDTTKELYDEVDKLSIPLDINNICDNVKYSVDLQGKVSIRNAVVKHSEAICELYELSKQKYEGAIQVDLDCLDWKKMKVMDTCDPSKEVKPKNLCEALQRIINAIDPLI